MNPDAAFCWRHTIKSMRRKGATRIRPVLGKAGFIFELGGSPHIALMVSPEPKVFPTPYAAPVSGVSYEDLLQQLEKLDYRSSQARAFVDVVLSEMVAASSRHWAKN